MDLGWPFPGHKNLHMCKKKFISGLSGFHVVALLLFAHFLFLQGSFTCPKASLLDVCGREGCFLSNRAKSRSEAKGEGNAKSQSTMRVQQISSWVLIRLLLTSATVQCISLDPICLGPQLVIQKIPKMSTQREILAMVWYLIKYATPHSNSLSGHCFPVALRLWLDSTTTGHTRKASEFVDLALAWSQVKKLPLNKSKAGQPKHTVSVSTSIDKRDWRFRLRATD